MLGQFANARRSDSGLDAYTFGLTYIARLSGDSGYGSSDFDEDIDAILIGYTLSSAAIDDSFADYYDVSSGDVLARYSTFLDVRFDGDWDNAYDAAVDALVTLDPLVVAMREGIWAAEVGLPPLGPTEITPTDIANISQAWIEVLQQHVTDE